MQSRDQRSTSCRSKAVPRSVSSGLRVGRWSFRGDMPRLRKQWPQGAKKLGMICLKKAISSFDLVTTLQSLYQLRQRQTSIVGQGASGRPLQSVTPGLCSRVGARLRKLVMLLENHQPRGLFQTIFPHPNIFKVESTGAAGEESQPAFQQVSQLSWPES